MARRMPQSLKRRRAGRRQRGPARGADAKVDISEKAKRKTHHDRITTYAMSVDRKYRRARARIETSLKPHEPLMNP